MANSAEVVHRLAVQVTCQKILLAIREDCKTIEDIEKYIIQLLNISEIN